MLQFDTDMEENLLSLKWSKHMNAFLQILSSAKQKVSASLTYCKNQWLMFYEQKYFNSLNIEVLHEKNINIFLKPVLKYLSFRNATQMWPLLAMASSTKSISWFCQHAVNILNKCLKRLTANILSLCSKTSEVRSLSPS